MHYDVCGSIPSAIRTVTSFPAVLTTPEGPEGLDV
jgi:hypothetical protein